MKLTASGDNTFLISSSPALRLTPEHVSNNRAWDGPGCGGRRRFFGDNDRRRSQQAVTQFVTFANLLDDLPFGRVVGFQLRNGLVSIGSNGLPLHQFLQDQPRRENPFELLLNHGDAGCKDAIPLAGFRGLRAACAISHGRARAQF